MKIVLRLLIVFMLLQPLATFAQSDAGKQTEVLGRMWTLKTALVAKDSATLMSVLSPDVSYGHSNGLVQTRAGLIRSVMSGEQDYTALDPSDIKIRFYDNAAIATLLLKVTMNFEGKPLKIDMKVLMVWVKKDKDWMLVARQSGKIS